MFREKKIQLCIVRDRTRDISVTFKAYLHDTIIVYDSYSGVWKYADDSILVDYIRTAFEMHRFRVCSLDYIHQNTNRIRESYRVDWPFENKYIIIKTITHARFRDMHHFNAKTLFTIV